MEPTKDQFEQHVRGLYEGLEIPPPLSTKSAVFNALDQKSITSYTGAILFAGTLLFAIGAWYISSTGQADASIQSQSMLDDDIFTDIVENPAVETTTIFSDEVVEDVAPELVEKTTFEESTSIKLPSEEAITHVSKQVDSPIINMEVVSMSDGAMVDESKVDLFKEVIEPFEDKTPASAETKKEMKKEEVEWVLPASIKVEK